MIEGAAFGSSRGSGSSILAGVAGASVVVGRSGTSVVGLDDEDGPEDAGHWRRCHLSHFLHHLVVLLLLHQNLVHLHRLPHDQTPWVLLAHMVLQAFQGR